MAIIQVYVISISFKSRLLAYLLLTTFVLSLGIFITICYLHDDLQKRVQEQEDENIQTIPECSCRRQYLFPKRNRSKILSSCSDQSTWYEPSQNVVTFSYYNIYKSRSKEGVGQAALYKTGLLENLRRIRQFYPGYLMRIYTNASLEKGNDFCKIICSNPDVHWCDIKNVPGYRNLEKMHPMTWRFLPLGDSSVDNFLSRDLDSIITEREVAAVQDWLNISSNTGKGIHSMRDHPSHNQPMLGGLWGASNKILEKKNAKTLQRLVVFWSRHPKIIKMKGFDQSVLKTVIFSRKPSLVLAHDSYHCMRWNHVTVVRPFPVRRKNAVSDFTGNPNLGRGIYKMEVCPVECRPEYGKDWKYC